MYDTYTVAIFTAEDEIIVKELLFDNNATLIDLCDAIREFMVEVEEGYSHITSYNVYEGEHLDDFEKFIPLAIDIC